jgi:hypothetical protein
MNPAKEEVMARYTLEYCREDAEGKEVVREYELGDANALIVTNDPELGIGVAHYKVSDDSAFELRISDSVVIRQTYLKIAQALCRKYSEVIPQTLAPGSIVFTVDEEWEPAENSTSNSTWKVEIKKATKWLRAFTGYRYEIQLRQWWINEWSEAQLNAAIMSQLLRISPKGNGTIKKYSMEFPDALFATFGLGYLERDIEIPDLIEDDVELQGFTYASAQEDGFPSGKDDERGPYPDVPGEVGFPPIGADEDEGEDDAQLSIDTTDTTERPWWAVSPPPAPPTDVRGNEGSYADEVTPGAEEPPDVDVGAAPYAIAQAKAFIAGIKKECVGEDVSGGEIYDEDAVEAFVAKQEAAGVFWDENSEEGL